MGQSLSEVPSINISDHTLKVVERFTCLGSSVSDSVPLNRQTGKATTAIAKLSKRVLTPTTKMIVYRPWVLNTFLNSSESWKTYMRQEGCLIGFRL